MRRPTEIATALGGLHGMLEMVVTDELTWCLEFCGSTSAGRWSGGHIRADHVSMAVMQGTRAAPWQHRLPCYGPSARRRPTIRNGDNAAARSSLFYGCSPRAAVESAFAELDNDVRERFHGNAGARYGARPDRRARSLPGSRRG